MTESGRTESIPRVRAQLVTILGVYVLPVILAIQVTRILMTGEPNDFDANVWQPIHAIFAGHSPYPAPELSDLVGRRTFVYPVLLLWVDLPFSLFSHQVAQIAFAVVSGAAVVAGMRVVGVRDKRCLAVALLSLPVSFGLAMGNPTVLLVLPIALAWRYRDKPWAAGLAVAVVVAVKPLLWPLGLWLLVTRRFRATAIGIVAGGAAVVGTWAMIGFKGMTDYPHLVSLIGAKTAGPRGLSINTLAHDLGLSYGTGRMIQLACGATLLGALFVMARGRNGDRRAFSLALAAGLMLSPVMWLHYVAILLVPLAIARPAYGSAWHIPRVLWVLALVPMGKLYVVTDGGRTYGTFGFIPPAEKVVIVLGFVAAITAIAGFDAKLPRLRELRWRSIPTEPQRSLP